MSSQGGDKTEDPTPKRKRDARKEGQIPKSAEIGSWTAMLMATLLLQLTIGMAAQRMTAVLHDAVRIIERPEVGPAIALFGDGLASGALVVAPLALGLLVLGVAVNLAQVGWAPSGKLLKPKMERVNPFKGMKRLLSPHSIWEGAKTLLKVIILGALAYRAVMDIVPVLVAGGRQDVAATMVFVGGRALALVRNVSLAGLGLALVDYGLQRRKTAKGMKMTKQDVRDEHKQSEGDPQMRGAIRSKQMSMSRNRMMSEVATADVVLVNPTHVAVALRYEAATGAPRVVAKGSGAVAARIRGLADDAGVPMVQDVPLARAVFRACDLGEEIPAELYDAVARVLAFIFALNRRGAARGLHHMPGAIPAAAAG
jgi:flagellar biosynthetic protein FlhB